jgi:hypothetical protein
MNLENKPWGCIGCQILNCELETSKLALNFRFFSFISFNGSILADLAMWRADSRAR